MAQDFGISDDLHAAILAYCDAVYFAKADVFETLCHDKFQMTHVENDGTTFWDKASYLDRVRGRTPFPAPAQNEILNADEAGGEIGRVHLTVDVPPVRYEDHLGFVKLGGEWTLLTKVFRTAAQLENGGS